MRILHILDHSIPLQSGYTFRTRNILREQDKLGWDTYHVTGLKQRTTKGLEEVVDGLHFYRTPDRGFSFGQTANVQSAAGDQDSGGAHRAGDRKGETRHPARSFTGTEWSGCFAGR